MGGATPEQVVLGCMKKQADETMQNEPVSSITHGSCLCSSLSFLI